LTAETQFRGLVIKQQRELEASAAGGQITSLSFEGEDGALQGHDSRRQTDEQ